MGCFQKKYINLQRFYSIGAIAQLVEHRTENPGVPGSIPGGTTAKPRKPLLIFGFSGASLFLLTVILLMDRINMAKQAETIRKRVQESL